MRVPAQAAVTVRTSGTVVVPAWATKARIVAIGGGRGGSYPNGGDHAVPIDVTVDVVPGETLTVVIGAGGTPDAAGQDTTVTGSRFALTAAGATTGTQTGNGALGVFIDGIG